MASFYGNVGVGSGSESPIISIDGSKTTVLSTLDAGLYSIRGKYKYRASDTEEKEFAVPTFVKVLVDAYGHKTIVYDTYESKKHLTYSINYSLDGSYNVEISTYDVIDPTSDTTEDLPESGDASKIYSTKEGFFVWNEILQDYVQLGKDVYTKGEVDDIINQLQTLHFEIVDSIDEVVKPNVRYLIKKDDVTGKDVYEEYILINGVPTLIGETSIDLSGYAKLEDLETTNADIEELKVVSVTKTELRTIANLVKYEIVSVPTGTQVDYRQKEIRIYCPETVDFNVQQVGAGGNPNCYYVPFRAYAPEAAESFKEDMSVVINDQTMHSFVGNPTAGIDSYGRKYSTVWLALAVTADGGETWTYYGKNSTVNHYIGFDYSVEWYDKNGVMISSDTIRINLANKDCYLTTDFTTDQLVNGNEEFILDCGNATEE